MIKSDKADTKIIKDDSLSWKMIDFLNLGNLFEEAKWRMYCIHCDDTMKWLPVYQHLPTVPFGFLNHT
jgi:hypothetical protein